MKKKILEDTKDLIRTLYGKGTDLKRDPNFLALWSAKNKRLQEAAQKLTAEELKELEKDFSEWMAQEYPHVKVSKFAENP